MRLNHVAAVLAAIALPIVMVGCEIESDRSVGEEEVLEGSIDAPPADEEWLSIGVPRWYSYCPLDDDWECYPLGGCGHDQNGLVCYPSSCGEDSDCPSVMACQGGQCRFRCTFNGHCPVGDRCVARDATGVKTCGP